MADSLPETCFIDTNIWLYAFIEGSEPGKSLSARSILRNCLPVVSVQIVNEVCVNLIKKANFPEEKVRELIESFYENYQVVTLDQMILSNASNLRLQYSFSFWDSLVIAAALAAQVKVVYSEDIQHGLQVGDNLRIINPL